MVRHTGGMAPTAAAWLLALAAPTACGAIVVTEVVENDNPAFKGSNQQSGTDADNMAIGARWKDMSGSKSGAELYVGLNDLGKRFSGGDFQRTERQIMWPRQDRDPAPGFTTGWMDFTVTFTDFATGEVQGAIDTKSPAGVVSGSWPGTPGFTTFDYGGPICAMKVWLRAPNKDNAKVEVRELRVGDTLIGSGAFETTTTNYPIKVYTDGIPDTTQVTGQVRFTTDAENPNYSSELSNLEIKAGADDGCAPTPEMTTDAATTDAATTEAATTMPPEGSMPSDASAAAVAGGAAASASIQRFEQRGAHGAAWVLPAGATPKVGLLAAAALLALAVPVAARMRRRGHTSAPEGGEPPLAEEPALLEAAVE